MFDKPNPSHQKDSAKSRGTPSESVVEIRFPTTCACSILEISLNCCPYMNVLALETYYLNTTVV